MRGIALAGALSCAFVGHALAWGKRNNRSSRRSRDDDCGEHMRLIGTLFGTKQRGLTIPRDAVGFAGPRPIVRASLWMGA
jgi:hypothetical protein